MLALINLALCLSSFLAFTTSVPLIHLSTSHESRPERCSRKVNRAPEPAHIVEVLGILHEVVHKFGNRKPLSGDDELTLCADASEATLC